MPARSAPRPFSISSGVIRRRVCGSEISSCGFGLSLTTRRAMIASPAVEFADFVEGVVELDDPLALLQGAPHRMDQSAQIREPWRQRIAIDVGIHQRDILDDKRFG